MKTSTLLSLSFVVALSSLAVSVGCTQTVPAGFDSEESEVKAKDKDDDDDKEDSDDEDEDKTSKKTSSSGSTDQTSSGATTSSGGIDDPGSSSGNTSSGGTSSGEVPTGGDEGEACFAQCTGNDPAALQIDQQLMNVQCGDTDDRCWDQAINQICQGKDQLCDKVFSCGEQCFGGGQQ